MTRLVRSAFFATAALLVASTSCNDQPTAPKARAAQFKGAASNVVTPSIVISQVYGGGGNSGAVYKNDFIELFNPGAVAVDVTGWSVQYASSGGTSWTVTSLSGTVQPGAYYLIQEAAGAGGTTGLPTPDATGSGSGIAMAAGASKVFLSNTSAALTLACPASATVVDKTSYGTGASDCGFGTTATLANTTAAIRNAGGCAYTGSMAADFTVAAPTPRNSASPTHSCGGPVQVVTTVTVAPSTATVTVGGTQQFTATAFDAGSNPISGVAFTWSSTAAATVSASGLATGASEGDATITATAPNAVAGTAALHVNPPPPPPPPSDIVISQVYGAGGNSGATLTNDFIEIFNRGDTPANVTGWSVQYISANGTGNWTVTPLAGSIPAHSYFLVQETAGAGGTTPLPTPDVTGTIAMGGSAGKVALSNATVALNGACPSGTSVIDRVGYGTGDDTNGCGSTWGRTDDLAATTAAFRLMDGCFATGKSSFDFLVQVAAPRNSAAAPHACPAPSTASIVINEILAEPLHAAGGASWGEWFEVKNTGATPVDLQGWTITTQGQASHTIATSVVVPPGGIKLLGRGFDPAQNGGVTLDYNYFTTSPSAIFLDPRDFILLTDASGGLADFVRWTASNTFVIGSSKGVKDASADNMDAGGTNWGFSTTQFGDGDFGTPGAENGVLADTPAAFPNTVSFTGRFPSDQALPVGFEDQLFATENLGTGGTLATTFAWTALNPTIATIDVNGVMHALAAGNATFRATALDGTTGSITLPMMVATLSTTANYGNHTEFGDPVDADPSDDFIIRRFTYTTSYNKNLNHPNWVSYNLDASQIGTEDRCDCFTHDPELPASFTVIKTSDYTGAGAVAGFGIDRGHMARSFDRTTGTLDNATTYYFSNIIPQANALNTQQWATFETFLGDKARFSNKEVYIITGPAGTRGTVKNEGKINIPAWVWKVAVIMPRDKGLTDVHNYTDVEVIAVSVANDPSSTTPWQSWQVSVDSVEALTGYNLLSALPDNIEAIVEANIKPPLGAINGPFSLSEGGSVSMSGASSFDPNGSIVSYAWNFGDGSSVASGASVSHTYAQDGNYTVSLTVTDNDGLTNTVTTTASVANVAPFVSAFAGATLIANESYSSSGTFSDPGDDVCTATVNYGDGSGAQTLSLSGGGFSLSHTYTAAGTFTVTVQVSDDDVTTTQTATVVVLSAQQALANIAASIDQLNANGVINNGNANSLKAKLNAATQQLNNGNVATAKNQLNALLNEIDAMRHSGRLSVPDANALRTAVQAVLATL